MQNSYKLHISCPAFDIGIYHFDKLKACVHKYYSEPYMQMLDNLENLHCIQKAII